MAEEIDPNVVAHLNDLRQILDVRSEERDVAVRENVELKRQLAEARAAAGGPSKKHKSTANPVGWSVTGKAMVQVWIATKTLKEEADKEDDKAKYDQLEIQRGILRNMLNQLADACPEFAHNFKSEKRAFLEKRDAKLAIARLTPEELESYKANKDKDRATWIKAWIATNPDFMDKEERPKEKKSRKRKSATETDQPETAAVPNGMHEAETETLLPLPSDLLLAEGTV